MAFKVVHNTDLYSIQCSNTNLTVNVPFHPLLSSVSHLPPSLPLGRYNLPNIAGYNYIHGDGNICKIWSHFAMRGHYVISKGLLRCLLLVEPSVLGFVVRWLL